MRAEFQERKFRNEEEEANWWDSHQDELADEFQRAAAAGTLGSGTAARKGATPTTTIRLAQSDIVLARTQAERRGLKYQTYLKMVIHQALRQEEEQVRTKGARKNAGSKSSTVPRHR